MNDKFTFLYSPRFWQLAIMGLSAGLAFAYPDNRLALALGIMVNVWFGGSVAVRTIDRASEQKALPPQ